ncbi:eCIS core domain-containing protein [Nitrogeniibacter aestuarii]|uniref:eCIS core domain-containing protein n=1 Tax=Nitrogeniibacter aestuarii TaxID=2815343 RepID=UPI001D11403B|nr:DUF4157 domain-containing protein [Nitrogeniibacter aestuarii]
MRSHAPRTPTRQAGETSSSRASGRTLDGVRSTGASANVDRGRPGLSAPSHSHDEALERHAEAVADRVVANTPSAAGAPTPRRPTSLPQRPLAHPLMNAAGEPLAAATRADMEQRFSAVMGGGAGGAFDFSQIRIHAGPAASGAARAMGALAYTAGNHIVFNEGTYAPHTHDGRRLLAHELAHVTQNPPTVQCYRPNAKRSFNFGTLDDPASGLVEDSFNKRKDKETKPWIEHVNVTFNDLQTDAGGHVYSTGWASAQYYDNPVKWPDFNFPVGGGSRTLGRTDSGTFTVKRIMGVGYNSGTYSGTPGVDYDKSDREGPGRRYSKSLSANMSYAVFYNGGEALHAGPLDASSHGCVHVDWDQMDLVKQLNYHSVIGLTKVTVKYLSKSEMAARKATLKAINDALNSVDEMLDLF